MNLQGPGPSSGVSFWIEKGIDLLSGVVRGLIVAAILGTVAYLRSPRFKDFVQRLGRSIRKTFVSVWRWTIRHLPLLIGLILLLAVVYASNLIFQTFTVGVLLIFLAIAIILIVRSPVFPSSGQDQLPKFQPIEINSSIGNYHLQDYYGEPPTEEGLLSEIPFSLRPDSLVFDTSGQMRFPQGFPDGGQGVSLALPQAVKSVGNVHFLISSGNSKLFYEWQRIGKIRLIFHGEHEGVFPAQSLDLILGDNVREWAPGNRPADYVTRTTDPRTRLAWRGKTRDGRYAIMDQIEVPISEFNKTQDLVEIQFIHYRLQHEQDDLGAHFIVFGITLETEQQD